MDEDETPCVWCHGGDCGQGAKCESVNTIATMAFENRLSAEEKTAACGAVVPSNLRCADHPHTPDRFVLGQRHKYVCELNEDIVWYECVITNSSFSIRGMSPRNPFEIVHVFKHF